jgi:hypothetical protein
MIENAAEPLSFERLGVALGFFLTLAGVIIATGKYVLKNFVATHVNPTIADLTHGLKASTTATATLTTALADSNLEQKKGRQETHQALTGINAILSDHEARIRVNESQLEQKPRPKRTA